MKLTKSIFLYEPIEAFTELFSKVEASGVKDANAMTLSTVGLNNKPSSRVVLYKGLFQNNITFYTNYQSQKAQEIESNPNVALNFFWSQFDLQIRIEGVLQKLPRLESEKYFLTRPRISQIGAWASQQSQKIDNYDQLQRQVESFEDKFKNQTVPCPPHWGGYYITANYYEFWFGQTGRLHERYAFKLEGKQWGHQMLSP